MTAAVAQQFIDGMVGTVAPYHQAPANVLLRRGTGSTGGSTRGLCVRTWHVLSHSLSPDRKVHNAQGIIGNATKRPNSFL